MGRVGTCLMLQCGLRTGWKPWFKESTCCTAQCLNDENFLELSTLHFPRVYPHLYLTTKTVRFLVQHRAYDSLSVNIGQISTAFLVPVAGMDGRRCPYTVCDIQKQLYQHPDVGVCLLLLKFQVHFCCCRCRIILIARAFASSEWSTLKLGAPC